MLLGAPHVVLSRANEESISFQAFLSHGALLASARVKGLPWRLQAHAMRKNCSNFDCLNAEARLRTRRLRFPCLGKWVKDYQRPVNRVHRAKSPTGGVDRQLHFPDGVNGLQGTLMRREIDCSGEGVPPRFQDVSPNFLAPWRIESALIYDVINSPLLRHSDSASTLIKPKRFCMYLRMSGVLAFTADVADAKDSANFAVVSF